MLIVSVNASIKLSTMIDHLFRCELWAYPFIIRTCVMSTSPQDLPTCGVHVYQHWYACILALVCMQTSLGLNVHQLALVCIHTNVCGQSSVNVFFIQCLVVESGSNPGGKNSGCHNPKDQNPLPQYGRVIQPLTMKLLR